MSNLYLKQVLCLIPVSCLIAFPGYAAENDFSLGLGAAYSTSTYKDYDENVFPLPIVNYDNKVFFVHGLSAGAYLYQDEYNVLQASVSYYAQEFDPDDANNSQMKLLDKRDSTAMGAISYTFRSPLGNITSSLAIDVLDESDGGMIASAQYNYPIPFTQQLTIIPEAGIKYSNSDLNQHYYGVSSSESARSGLTAYDPGSAVTPYFGVAFRYNVSDTLSAFIASRYQVLPDEIQDSPMVDSSHTIQTSAGISYRF
ncbi:MipA/OmpV family protein [Vibrio spartinae]|uniref:MltA-interacting protein n=1 Tax=Vibrio spartinae TaxID=1918945 RepID=A0A1N6LZA6_9VIBR|nr:MipA/OmpV family protein [Vibrio spartinae]QMV16466.1 MltA-interacting protein precursor [Vibrio spartinae]SIO92461.1 MltA-interacting protein precursor [Vibrio spartinae]